MHLLSPGKNRRLFRSWAILLMLGVACGLAQQASTPPAPPFGDGQIGYRAAGNADKNKTLLLNEFQPLSMLQASSHEVPRAKFYVIDVHNHLNDARGIDEHMDPQRVLQILDNTNVRTVVILTGMLGEQQQRVIDESVC
jgi:hypothetical protein